MVAVLVLRDPLMLPPAGYDPPMRRVIAGGREHGARAGARRRSSDSVRGLATGMGPGRVSAEPARLMWEAARVWGAARVWEAARVARSL